MPKTLILGIIFFTAFFLTAYSSGPTSIAGDATGSPVTDASCAGCHNGGSFNPMTSISLLDQGEIVAAYEPNKEYTLQISVASENAPSAYGFQAVILDANNANAGTISDVPDDFRVSTRQMRDYLEHTRRQSDSLLQVKWTAPATGSGELTVYAAANAVNLNSQTSGDNVDLASLTIAEDQSSSSSDVSLQKLNVWQSSATSLQVTVPKQTTFPAKVRIIDQAGRLVQSTTLLTPTDNIQIDQSLAAYIVLQIQDFDGKVYRKPIVLY